MRVAVVVPFRSGCPYREAAWRYIRSLYAEHHPGWQVIEAPAPEGPWCKGAALNSAIEACDAEIVIQADADVWTDGLSAAVETVKAGAAWTIPHDKLHRLSQGGTEAVLAGAPWQDQPLDQKPYRATEGGGVIVASREVLLAVGVDSRFKSWGQEDESHAVALHTLLGPPGRGTADLWHLWHPPQPRMTRRRGSRESWELRKRYFRAQHDPVAMQKLIEEGRRVTSPALESSLHPDAELAGINDR